MLKPTNNNNFFKFFQPKLFYINKDIDKDDPVRLLSAILEEMDFSNLMQVFPNKTKVHPVNMFAVIIYAYSKGCHKLMIKIINLQQLLSLLINNYLFCNCSPV